MAQLLWERSHCPMVAAHMAAYTYRHMPTGLLHEDDKTAFAVAFDRRAHNLLNSREARMLTFHTGGPCIQKHGSDNTKHVFYL